MPNFVIFHFKAHLINFFRIALAKIMMMTTFLAISFWNVDMTLLLSLFSVSLLLPFLIILCLVNL